MYYTFSILGGDNRFGAVSNLLSRDGHTVLAWGLNSNLDLGNARLCEHIGEAIEGADVVVLPIPAISSDGNLNLPFSEKQLDVSTVLSMMCSRQILAGGILPTWLLDLTTQNKISVIDYGKREDFIVANAVPTAEGAIGIAMRELNRTLWDSKCMVVGYGRIGKVLANRLSALCPRVTVVARNPKDLAQAEVLGFEVADYDSWKSELNSSDVIFNTVPFLVLDQNALKEIPKTSVIVDLASRPGGTDFKAAEAEGIKTIWALSLPGKTAPYTAGKVIYNSILNGIRELK